MQHGASVMIFMGNAFKSDIWLLMKEQDLGAYQEVILILWKRTKAKKH